MPSLNTPLDVHTLMVTAYQSQLEAIQQTVFKRCGLSILFFYKKFYFYSIIRLVLRCLLVARKENLTNVSTGLTGWSKNLDLTGNPTGRSTRPVSISAPDGPAMYDLLLQLI